MTEEDRAELRRLRREMETCSLGDRPQSMSSMKLQRLIDLEAREIQEYAVRAMSPSKSYTLDDLTRLAAEWITEQEGDTEMLKWAFSIFVEWARKREREVGDGD